MSFQEQQRYWDREAATASFSLGFDLEQVIARLPTSAPVLDLGCGYGRSLETLAGAGFQQLVGLDPSREMIARARERVPGAHFEVVPSLPIDHADASFDLILLIAVLTCVPEDDGQRGLIAEVARLLRPGGLVCVSDFLLLDNDRNRPRYQEAASHELPYGVFDTEDGARHRHHTTAWVDVLLSPFSQIAHREVAVETRRGNPARAFEYIGERMM